MFRMRLSPLLTAHAHLHRRPLAIPSPPELALLPGAFLLKDPTAQRLTSLLVPHTSEPLVLRERKTHLLVPEPMNPTTHHTQVQVLLQANPKARTKAALALQAGDPLVHRRPDLKAILTGKVAHRLQARDLLAYRMLRLKVILTVRAAHRLQARDLLVYRMLRLKGIPTVRAAHRLQDPGTRQEYRSRHRPSSRTHKVAHPKQRRPDQRQRLLLKLSQAVLPGRTFLS